MSPTFWPACGVGLADALGVAAFEAPGPAVKKNTCVAVAKAMTTSTPATARTLSRFRRRCWCACTLWRAVNRLSRSLASRACRCSFLPDATFPPSVTVPPTTIAFMVDTQLGLHAGATPLAVRMRPRSLDEIAGQRHLLTPGSPLLGLAADSSGPQGTASVILWGPPGTGKTTIAQAIARTSGRAFVQLSAVTAGVKDVRLAMEEAMTTRDLYGRSTVLFLDEIHRFSKAQQDALLPGVENGWVILIAATTENPSFSVIAPLLSRSLLLTLDRAVRRRPRHGGRPCRGGSARAGRQHPAGAGGAFRDHPACLGRRAPRAHRAGGRRVRRDSGAEGEDERPRS